MLLLLFGLITELPSYLLYRILKRMNGKEIRKTVRQKTNGENWKKGTPRSLVTLRYRECHCIQQVNLKNTNLWTHLYSCYFLFSELNLEKLVRNACKLSFDMPTDSCNVWMSDIGLSCKKTNISKEKWGD